MLQLTVAALLFVGTHFLLSHPLRGTLVRAIGERGFLGVYALIAAVTLGWLVFAYRAAPMQPLWWNSDNDLLWAVVTVVMLVASVLMIGSLLGNPALPTGGAPGAVPDAARGVFAVTRHPMMWAFALWAGCHVLVYPVAANAVLCGAIGVLALVGAALQDRKKEQLQPGWREWERRTSWWPFAAIAQGRARFGGFRPHDLAGGAVLWLAATWAHLPLAGWAAGIWRWI